MVARSGRATPLRGLFNQAQRFPPTGEELPSHRQSPVRPPATFHRWSTLGFERGAPHPLEGSIHFCKRRK
eukprot:scaffold239988_cov26-Tisochrysis_lutea.AAC.4